MQGRLRSRAFAQDASGEVEDEKCAGGGHEANFQCWDGLDREVYEENDVLAAILAQEEDQQ